MSGISEMIMGCTVVLLMIAMCIWMILLGRVVYKDAKAHGMPAGMWATIAVIIPNLLGVIIYLVVRKNEEKKYVCSECGAYVEEAYNVCPSCRHKLGRSCQACNHGITEDCVYCPYCGEKVEKQEGAVTGRVQVAKTNISKPLIKLGITFVLILVIGLGTLLGVGFTASFSKGDFSVMNIETNIGNTRKASFVYKQDHIRIRQDKEQGEELIVALEIDIDEGAITLELEAPSEEVVFHEIYNAPIQITEQVEMIEALESGRYTLGITVNGASGSYNISMD